MMPPEPPASGPAAPYDTPAEISEDRRTSRWIAVGAIAVVVFLLAGVGAYAIAHGVRKEDTKYCGYDCVPGLKITTVVAALQGQGHDCSDNRKIWSCVLRDGRLRFDVDLFRSTSGLELNEYIRKAEVRITNPEHVTLAGADLSYMSWFAILPHRDDPETVKKIKDWLTQGIGADEDVAYILDWEYRLRRDAKTGSAELKLWRRW